jgi:hypothetical protein
MNDWLAGLVVLLAVAPLVSIAIWAFVSCEREMNAYYRELRGTYPLSEEDWAIHDKLMEEDR